MLIWDFKYLAIAFARSFAKARICAFDALFRGPTAAWTLISASPPTDFANFFNLALLAFVRTDDERSNLIFELAETFEAVATTGAAEAVGVGDADVVGDGAGVDEKARIGSTELVAKGSLPKFLYIPLEVL